MALITDATTAWSSPVTLTSDEIWQCRKGAVFVTTSVSPDVDDGLEMHETHAVRLPSGAAVQYRKIGTTDAVIVREAV